MMLKKISILLIILAALSACKSFKDSVPGENGGGSEGTDTKSSYAYLGQMYKGTNGSALEDKVLSGATMTYYKEDIKQLLNVFLQFGPTDGIVTTSKAWYTSLPPEIQSYVTQAGNDFPTGYANYLKTDAGKTYLMNQIDRLKTKLDRIAAYAEEIQFCKVTSTIDKCQSIIPSPFSAASGINADPTAFTTLANPLGLVDIFGLGNVANQAILAKLGQIITMLQNIQVTLARIEGKIDLLNIDTKHQSFEESISTLEGLYKFIADNKANPDIIKSTLITELTTFNKWDKYLYNAYTSSTSTLNYIQTYTSNIGTQKALGVYAQINLDAASKGQPVTEWSIDMPAKKLLIPLQDLQGMIRLSLSRIELLSQAYTGEELVERRKTYAQSDYIAYLSQLKTNYNSIKAFIDSWANNQTLPIGYSISEVGDCYCLVWPEISQNVFSDNNRNLIFNYYSQIDFNYYNRATNIQHGPYGDYNLYTVDNKITDYSFIPASLNNSLQNVKSYNSQVNKFRDYMVMYGALLARWEIELRAHAKTGGLEL